MELRYLELKGPKLIIAGWLFFECVSNQVYAAKAIDLSKQEMNFLSFTNHEISMKETSREVDFRKTTHIRMQETFQGYEVIGADAVTHIRPLAVMNAKTTNGIVYQDLNADLANAASYIFTNVQADKALRHAILLHQDQFSEITRKESKLMIWIDDASKAHWVYRINFRCEYENQRPEEMIYILDATTFDVYQYWDNIQTLSPVEGGGYGGNIRVGRKIYDGLPNHNRSLAMSRDDVTNICYLLNQYAIVKNYAGKQEVMSFPCELKNEEHNNVYWNASFDGINQAYSPSNDALFGGQMLAQMYLEWYKIPVFTTPLTLLVHDRRRSSSDNAYWDPGIQAMIFGEGNVNFYPMVSVGIAAHEISHAFTSMHSKLMYANTQSGAMNESFSDMAAQAAEVYAYGEGKNSWQIGSEVMKVGLAIRYMDQPSKDCKGRAPGSGCSVDDANQYNNISRLNPHLGSGVYNRFFYTLATTQGWDVKKAFAIMVQANQHYWTSGSTFNAGACGVIHAASDFGYDVEAVKNAFLVVQVRC